MSVIDDVNAANQKTTLRVNVWDYPSVVCDSCGHEIFVPAVIFKRISGIAVGMGNKEITQPVPIYVCAKCGDVMPEFKEDMQTTEQKQKQTNSLIL